MLSTGDFLNLSTVAYDANTTSSLPLLTSTGYNLLLRTSDVFSSTYACDGLEALAAYNSSNNHLIIAISGSSYYGLNTNLLDLDLDLLNDYALIQDKLPPQHSFAITFINTAISKIPAQLKKITFTGHSLGASLTELAAADFLAQGKYDIDGVTFDGPGTKPIFESQWPAITTLAYNKIITHLGAPNIVNTLNPQTGTLKQLEYHGRNRFFNSAYKLYENDKLSVKVIEEMVITALTHDDPLFFYTPHQMVTFQSEMNAQTGEFLGEFEVPKWNQDYSRSAIMADITTILADLGIPRLISLAQKVKSI